MILCATSIRAIKPVSPFSERSVHNGKTYGLSVAGYDIRIKQNLTLLPGVFSLASTLECFSMPKDVLGLVKNKSSWARQGLQCFETVIEPGWIGYLTIELSNLGPSPIVIESGDPIAQVLFLKMDAPTKGYSGKYQYQGDGPQEALYER